MWTVTSELEWLHRHFIRPGVRRLWNASLLSFVAGTQKMQVVRFYLCYLQSLLLANTGYFFFSKWLHSLFAFISAHIDVPSYFSKFRLGIEKVTSI
jgi:hypothetical protein